MTSIDDSSVKLTIIGKKKRWALTEKVDNILFFLSGSAPTAKVVRWEVHSFHGQVSLTVVAGLLIDPG